MARLPEGHGCRLWMTKLKKNRVACSLDLSFEPNENIFIERSTRRREPRGLRTPGVRVLG
jgi:hypothetical protein